VGNPIVLKKELDGCHVFDYEHSCPNTTYKYDARFSDGKKISGRVKTFPINPETLRIVAFSGFQPFLYEKKCKPPNINEDDIEFLLNGKDDLGEFFKHEGLKKEVERALQKKDDKEKEIWQPKGLPTLILGLGDQIYIDAEWGKGINTGLSLWGGKKEEAEGKLLPDYECQNEDYLERAFSKFYRGYFSFNGLQEALQNCPSIFMWDDHEIRGGWGSKRSDHDYKDYAKIAKKYYILYQAMRSMKPVETEALRKYPKKTMKAYLEYEKKDKPTTFYELKSTKTRAIWYQFKIGKYAFFIMDQRSQRRIDFSIPKKSTALGDEQLNDFRSWFKKYYNDENTRFLVIGSPVPLFEKLRSFVVFFEEKYSGTVGKDTSDDIRDRWQSEYNIFEFRKLLAIFDKYIKPGNEDKDVIIISGDIHKQSFYKIFKNEREFLYEFVASGLYQQHFHGRAQDFGYEYESNLNESVEDSAFKVVIPF